MLKGIIKKLTLLLLFTSLFSHILTGVVFSTSISDAKLVSQYSTDTTVDYMDTVSFGSYYQSNSSTKEPIEWIVLDRQGNKTLLLSKNILDCKCYNDVYKDITWENCTLRYWLNNTFYNTAFSSSEKSYIDNTYVINNDNASSNTNGGNNTYDNVFLLSIDEVNKYFYQSDMHTNNKRLATRGTNYAKNVDNNGFKLWVSSLSEWDNGNSDFWLRSPGGIQDYASNVDYDGYLLDDGFGVDYPDYGVRPALWVSNLSSSISKSNVEEIQNNKNSISTNQNNKSFLYSKYNEVLNDIVSTITIENYGKSYYLGYQLYDIDNDGIEELFIYRKLVYDYSNTEEVYLDTAYKMKDGQLTILYNCHWPDYDNYDEDIDRCYSLTDGRVLLIYSARNFSGFYIYDPKHNIVDKYLSDATGQYFKNDINITAEQYRQILNDAKSKRGYFSSNLSQGLIRIDNDDISINAKDNTSNYTIAGMPSRQAEWRSDNHFYLDDSMQRNKWVYYVTDYYHVDANGDIEKNKWIDQKYVGSDGKLYRGRQTPDGQYVGDNGYVVNVVQDLFNSVMTKTADPDSWYQTQSGLWYYFENDRTTTKKGWFKDYRDDQWYYFDLITGIMQVGWQKIDGKDYYFNEFHTGNNWYEVGGGFFESYGKKVKAYGSMFKSEKTPDGYWVNWNGEYIKNGNFFLAINPMVYVNILLLIILIILIIVIYLNRNKLKTFINKLIGKWHEKNN